MDTLTEQEIAQKLRKIEKDITAIKRAIDISHQTLLKKLEDLVKEIKANTLFVQ